jgi:predicted dehydrogenase
MFSLTEQVHRVSDVQVDNREIEESHHNPRQESSSRRQFLERTCIAMSAAVLTTKPAFRGLTGSGRKKIRLAVAGGGFGASHHWHEHPDCEITAVTDLVEERRQALIRSYRCNNVFPSLEEMLKTARDQFDAVAIFTDAPSHAKHAELCMNLGKHVVSACPVGITLEELHLLTELQKRTGMKYMMHESSYYRQPCIAAREAYQAGEFGRICFSEVEYYHPGIGARHNSLSRWQGLDSWRFGFPPMLYPTHSLGLLVGVTGERIVKVSCIGQRVGDDFPTAEENRYRNPFDNEIALGITDQGNICRFAVCWQIAAHGERGQWLGEKMSCWMDNSGGQPQAKRKLDGGWEKWNVPNYWESDRLPESMRHDSGHGGSSAFLSAEFIDALVEDREPAINLATSIAMTAPGIVAHESAIKGGEQLMVPEF